MARRTGLGVRTFVSLGTKADVSGNDLLGAWMDDPDVTAAGLHLESFGNAAKFARLARRFSERKPLLVVLGGSSLGGRRDALLGYSGLIPCRNADELAETALLLAEQPLPTGRRLAVLTNAGGMGVLAADAADVAGLVVPRLSDALQERLRLAPGLAAADNPVDVDADAGAADLGTTATELLASGEVDALLVVLVATRVADPWPLVDALAAARRSHLDVPVLLVTVGATDPPPGPATGVSSLPSITAAVEALARVSRYAAWLDVARVDPPAGDPERARATRRLAADLLDHTGEHAWLTPAQATELLAPYGLAPTLPGEPQQGAAGVELALGLVRDPTFGPLVVVAAGGAAGAQGDDRVHLLPPLDAGSVARALRSLRSWPLLDGQRGAPRADVAALVQHVIALGQLGTDVSEVAEVDVDPLLVDVDGTHLVDVKVRLAASSTLDTGVPRRLRQPR